MNKDSSSPAGKNAAVVTPSPQRSPPKLTASSVPFASVPSKVPFRASGARPAYTPAPTRPNSLRDFLFADGSTWPGNVPGLDLAKSSLLNPSGVPAWEAITQGVLAGLTPLERGLLQKSPTRADLVGLKASVLFRWRLAAMLATVPTEAGSPVDQEALEAALVDGDNVLMAIPAPETPDAESKEAFDNARAAVARDIVKIANFTQSLKPRDVNAPLSAEEQDARKAKATVQARAAQSTRVLAYKSVTPTKKRKPLPKLALTLAFSLLCAAGYHGYYYYLDSHFVDPLAKLNLPNGAVGNPLPNGDLLVTFQPGINYTAVDVELLRQKAKSEGKNLRELLPGQYLLAAVHSDAAVKPTP